MKTSLLAFVALAAAPLLIAASQEKVSFLWKPQAGKIAKYKTLNSHRADFGQGDQNLEISWNSVIKVEKVEGEHAMLALDNDEPLVKLGGSDNGSIQVQVPDYTEKHGMDLKFFPDASYEGMGFGLYSGFVLPKTALAEGDSYEADGLKAKYEGKEKVGDWDCHKFSFTYKPKDIEGRWTEGVIWLSVDDLSLVRRKTKLNNVDFGAGPETVNNEIIRTG